MLDKQKTKPSFIGLAGNIGVGKTTFTKLLSCLLYTSDAADDL